MYSMTFSHLRDSLKKRFIHINAYKYHLFILPTIFYYTCAYSMFIHFTVHKHLDLFHLFLNKFAIPVIQ